jgi:hypothetical protein
LAALDVSLFGSARLLAGRVEGLATNCFSDPNWLEIFEAHSGLTMEPCHNLATANGIPIAFLPAYIRSESLCGTLRDWLLGRLAKAPIFKHGGMQNALECSSPWGFYSGIEGSSGDRSDVFKFLINNVDQVARNRSLDLSGFTFVPESSRELRAQLQENGYKALPAGPTTLLELKWNSFDEYVADLPSRNIRSVVRRERKKAKRLSIEWFEGDSLGELYFGRPLFSIIMELYNNTFHKYAGTRSMLSDSFLPELWQTDKSNLRLCIAMLDRKVTAFVLLRAFSSEAHAFMVGRDYNLADDFQSYFNVIYYEPVVRGIKEGWRSIYYRPGVYEAKLRRGCRLERLFLYVKGHSVSAQAFLKVYIPAARKYFRHKYTQPSLFKY